MPDLINGLVAITPTSVTRTGTGSTASINSDGSVVFGSCNTLTVNGVFSSAYDNYLINIRYLYVSGLDYLSMRLSSNGTDSVSGYAYQRFEADGTNFVAARSMSETSGLIGYGSMTESGVSVYLYSPFLVETTSYRSIGATYYTGSGFYEPIGEHLVSSSYNGFTLRDLITPRTKSGLLTVFGFNQ